MSNIPDWFKIEHSKSIEDIKRTLPTYDSLHKEVISSLRTNYDLRLLGYSDEGEQTISEEERDVNFHILGAPKSGKSKFLEYHIQKDIDMGNGLCLIDPSDKADTANNVLAYCAKIGYEKVILIDPMLISDYKKIPCLAPLKQNYVHKSVEGVMESLAILFKGDYSSMRRIRRLLSALLRMLAKQGLTTNEAIYFSEYDHYAGFRKKIIHSDRDSRIIDDMFTSKFRFDKEFASTVNIMDVFWQEPLMSIIGNSEGIDFVRAVADGWVVLVNLSPYKLNDEQSKLLGIMVISQIIQAVDILQNSNRGNWDGRFYLYIDEVGRFATPQIDTLLSYKRKSGVIMYLAHHFYDQFEDNRKVLSSIENNTGVKLMFNTRKYEDRMQMIKSLGYGGDIPPVVASYANSDLPKQHAVLKKNKEAPCRIRIPDVETPPPASREYIEKILSQPFYKDVRSTPAHPKSPEYREVDDDKTDSQTPLPGRIQGEPDADLLPGREESPKPPEKRRIKI